ncbi:MAG: RHS repeat-associated core domain-containing protein [Proteobacteria bacterium]|nr:RHS repeat-associated core domain-containing protein [Pseudomonadota bacterium]
MGLRRGEEERTGTRACNAAGQLLGESCTGGVLDGLSLTYAYDGYLRRTNLVTLNSQLTPLSTAFYSYDSASRLATVSDGTNNATYGYLANLALVDSIVFKQNSTTRMVRTNRYDYLNRLTLIQTLNSQPSTINSFTYAYNDANQRIAVTNADSSRWSWGYDNLGQVTGGKRYWSDNSVVAGQQFEYAFDTIGNRTTASSGGDQYGSSLRTQTYGANTLNQYTNRTVPAYLEVQGSANSSATVTVNNDTVYRKGEYFRKELSTNNSSAAIWQGITNVAVLAGAGTNGSDIVTTQSGNLLVAQTPETFTYDADGNMTSDGKFNYTWDAENRLLAAESLTNAPAASRVRTEWIYQPDGRWSQRIAATWDGSTYAAQSTNRFLWDNKVLLAVLDGNDEATQAYLRGSDLSGSMAGAGGVGGLLAVSARTNGVHFAAFDGNGNVSALLSANNSTLTASYEYGPFGETLRSTGPVALVNSIRFSTQFADDATGHSKYLNRDCFPGCGRWSSRDSIAETGGNNLYRFSNNQPVTSIDIYGNLVFSLFSSAFGNCGGLSQQYLVKLDNAHPPGGYVVQKITFTYSITTAAGITKTGSITYYESIPFTTSIFASTSVIPPAVPAGPAGFDKWYFDDHPLTKGSFTLTGEAKFFPLNTAGNTLGGVNQNGPLAPQNPWIAGGTYGDPNTGPTVGSGTWASSSQSPSFWNGPALESANHGPVTRNWNCLYGIPTSPTPQPPFAP